MKAPIPEPLTVVLLAIVGVAVVLKQTPLTETASPPSSVIFPPLVAVKIVMLVVILQKAHLINVILEDNIHLNFQPLVCPDFLNGLITVLI